MRQNIKQDAAGQGGSCREAGVSAPLPGATPKGGRQKEAIMANIQIVTQSGAFTITNVTSRTITGGSLSVAIKDGVTQVFKLSEVIDVVELSGGGAQAKAAKLQKAVEDTREARRVATAALVGVTSAVEVDALGAAWAKATLDNQAAIAAQAKYEAKHTPDAIAARKAKQAEKKAKKAQSPEGKAAAKAQKAGQPKTVTAKHKAA